MDVKEAAVEYLPEIAPQTREDHVPSGYKRTEVGVIPKDWNIEELRDLIKSLDSGVSVNSDDGSKFVTTGEFILKTSCVFSGKFFPEESKPIAHRDIARAKLHPIADSIIISRMNTPTLVGESGYVEKNYLYLYVPDRLWLARSNPSICHSTRWLSHQLSSPVTARAIKDGATGTSGSMKNISKPAFLSVKIPLPPLEVEQRAIATALSDADALIAALQRLIAKKRAIKQGAMQALLTGRQRLPGFTGEWETKALGDFGTTYGGLTGKAGADFGHGSARYVPFMNVMTNVVTDANYLEFVDVHKAESQNRVERGDLLLNGSSETPEEVGLCSAVMDQLDNVFLNSFCFGFRPAQASVADSRYLAYYFRSVAGRELLAPLAQGATRYNLSKRALLQLEISLPRPEEQTAIATVLADMDAEIEALEARLAKTRALKAGMMQQLLTGRIRLPLEDAA